MRMRNCALTLALAALLLIYSGSASWSADPAGAAVVLQLPPSMPPDAVRALIAELAAKGAQPAAKPVDPATPASPSVTTTASLANEIWSATGEALASLPLLAEVPQRWAALAGAEGIPHHAATRFWIIALAGLMASPLIGQFARRLFDSRRRPVEPGLMPRLHAAGVKLLIAVASLAVFGIAYWTVLFFASLGGLILEQTADHLVWAVLKWRLLIIALAIIVPPYRPDLRLVAIDNADAAIWSRWVAVYLALNPAIWFVERLGFDHDVVFGAAFAFGAAVTAYKVAMYWAIQHPVARAIRAATGIACTPFRRCLASIWHWLFIGLAVAVMVAATIEFALGKGAWVTAASAATQGVIVVLAIIWQAGQKLIPRLFAAREAELAAALRRAGFERALLRLFDALLWIVGAAWLAQTWGLDLVNPAPGSIERLFVRPVLEAALDDRGRLDSVDCAQRRHR